MSIMRLPKKIPVAVSDYCCDRLDSRIRQPKKAPTTNYKYLFYL